MEDARLQQNMNAKLEYINVKISYGHNAETKLLNLETEN